MNAGCDLTDRELQVMALLADGRSNAQIAKALGCPTNAVRYRIRSAGCKLGVSGRAGLVAAGFRRGLLRVAVPETEMVQVPTLVWQGLVAAASKASSGNAEQARVLALAVLRQVQAAVVRPVGGP